MSETEQEVIPPESEEQGEKKRGRGRPEHVPTDESRKMVQSMAAVGIARPSIAMVLGISEPTLYKHYREILDTAGIKANAQVAGMLFKKCMDGDTASIIFWCKTRLGMRETTVNQVQRLDKDGKPMGGEESPTIKLIEGVVIEHVKKVESSV